MLSKAFSFKNEEFGCSMIDYLVTELLSSKDQLLSGSAA